jgi:hypothetical protein
MVNFFEKGSKNSEKSAKMDRTGKWSKIRSESSGNERSNKRKFDEEKH